VLAFLQIWDSAHGYDAATRSIDQSLKQSALSYFDLILIHSPNPGREKRLETYRALIDAKKAGKVKSIGVSNYGVKHIQELLAKYPDSPPSMNQIELSPFFQRKEIVNECLRHSIAIEAYSPLGKGAHTDRPELKEISKVSSSVRAWDRSELNLPLYSPITDEEIRQNAFSCPHSMVTTIRLCRLAQVVQSTTNRSKRGSVRLCIGGAGYEGAEFDGDWVRYHLVSPEMEQGVGETITDRCSPIALPLRDPTTAP
jgi:hypothetical protein